MSNYIISWSEISLMDWGLNIFIKSTCILFFVLYLSRLLANTTAKLRYRLWKGTFILLILFPFIGLLPTISTVSLNPTENNFQINSELPIPYAGILQNNELELGNSISKEPLTPEKANTSSHGNLSIINYFCIIWIIGSICFLALIVFEFYFLSRIVKQKRCLIPESWFLHLQSAQRQIGASRTPSIVLSKYVGTPVVFCLFRKNYILMPIKSSDWEEEQIKIVFLHELGHLIQKDLHINLFVQIVKAIYWWHPLVWIAVHKIQLECEGSCDELVLKNGVNRVDYAQKLTEIARNIYASTFSLSKVAVPMAKNTQLKVRISRILKEVNPSLHKKSRQNIKILLYLVLPIFFLNFTYTSSSIEKKTEAKLIKQLSNSNDIIKIKAAKTLGELKSPASYNQLVKALKSKNPKVRATVAWALGQIQNEEAVSALLPLINDQDDCVKEWALLSLGEYGTSKSFSSVLRTQGHLNPEIRKATLWSLHQIGCLPSFYHISHHLQDENKEVRLLAEKLLNDFPRERLQKWLLLPRNEKQNKWVYEHFLGVKNLGTTNLFVESLTSNKKEQDALFKIIRENSNIEVLDKIYQKIDNLR